MRHRHDNRVTPRVTHVTMYPMSETYTKLFHSIISSTVWVDTPLHVKVVWIALLAKADKDGEIYSSVRGLARDAGVTTDQCHEALDLFMQPDPESRTTTAEGRRIEKIDGGWALINHAKYREKTSLADRREKDRIRQQRKRERDRCDMSRKSQHTDSYTNSDQIQTQTTQKREGETTPSGDGAPSSKARKPTLKQTLAAFDRRPCLVAIPGLREEVERWRESLKTRKVWHSPEALEKRLDFLEEHVSEAKKFVIMAADEGWTDPMYSLKKIRDLERLDKPKSTGATFPPGYVSIADQLVLNPRKP